MKISFVIPVCDERDTLEPLYNGIAEHVPGDDFEIVFIDDGSTDGSADVLRGIAEKDARVQVITQDGNCGKSVALAAGFARVAGELVFTMDSDLQDDPAEIPSFLAKLDEGLDVVCGWKAIRHDPWHKTFPSRVYNGFVAKLFGLELHDVNCGYKLYRRAVIDDLHIYGELHRLLPILAQHRGYRIGEIAVQHKAREYGHSKYGLERFSRGALDVLTLWMLESRMRAPAHFFGKLAFLGGVVAGTSAVLSGLLWRAGYAVAGGVFAVSAVMILIGSGLVACMGLMAEFMLKHFVRIDPGVFEKNNNV